MTLEVDEDDLDGATKEVVGAIEHQGERIAAAIQDAAEKICEEFQAQTAIIVHELGRITNS